MDVRHLTVYLFLLTAWGLHAEPWRSDLYPEDWTPAMTDENGLFLPDFSYAGYRQGEPLPDATQTVINVVTAFKADNSGNTDSAEALQAAIHEAAKTGAVVFLPAGQYRCDEALQIRKSGVILRGAGRETELVFNNSDGMSDKGHISFTGTLKRGPDILLASDAENRSTTVSVAALDGLKVDDEVVLGWTITDAFIAEHKMTETWKAFNNKWRPFFRRRVVAIQPESTPPQVTLDIPLRYPGKVRDKASLRVESGYLTNCAVESISICNAVSRRAAWKQTRVQAIAFRQVADSWIRDVHSMASPRPEAAGLHLQSGGILVSDSKQVTITDCRMEAAQHRGGGGNGYLFQISRSNTILTRDCTAVAGRHNFIQNWDFGCSGCVWLRCTSRRSRAYHASFDPIGSAAYSEFHHSLAMACLIDQCVLEDGWYAGNRGDWSSGAGQTSTQCVFWNTGGGGAIRSWQVGMGYIIGTDTIRVLTKLRGRSARGTAPEDYREGIGKGAELLPSSLYDDQLKRRRGN